MNKLYQLINQVSVSYRWRICALLFVSTTINFLDRQVLSILKTDLTAEFGWSEIDYGNLVTAFQGGYALGFFLLGRLLDYIGTRKGYTLAIVLWSFATMAHALIGSISGFIMVRFCLGFGEAGNWPSVMKTVSEWFPKKERALAIGLINCGSNIAALLAPVIVAFITIRWGWQWSFIITGAMGLIWLVFWLSTYTLPENNAKVSAEELNYIKSDSVNLNVKISWKKLIGLRETWAFILGKFLTDPVWWIYLYWLPDFLKKHHGLSLTGLGLPMIIIYLIADVGSIGGGWMSSSLIKKGWSINKARKFSMFVFAVSVIPVIFVTQTDNLWITVLLFGLATAGHQAWSANLFTLVTDLFPQSAIGSASGIGMAGGAIGGMLIATVVGHILQYSGSYYFVFLIAGSAYLVALLIIQLLVPTIKQVEIKPEK